MKRIIFSITLLYTGLTSGETITLTALPKPEADSWKKVPGGITFIHQLKQEQQEKNNNQKAMSTSALQTAVDGDSPLMVKVLIERGLAHGNDIHEKDVYGQNLIHLTIDNESTKTLKALLKAGLNASEGDKLGITPLHLYLNLIIEQPKKKKFAQAAIKELLKAGANIHATGTFGVSPWEMVNWKKDGALIFDADTLALFLTLILPEEANFAAKGTQERNELIQKKIALAKTYLPFYYQTATLKSELEENIDEVINKL